MQQFWVQSTPLRGTDTTVLTLEPAKLGYKQELRRNFTMIEVFGIAFSIMGLLPSIASTLAYSIPAGPVGMVWVRELAPKNVEDYRGLTNDRAGSWHLALYLSLG